jgi:hypothetical protein
LTWLLNVWRTGLAGQRIARTNADWRREFEETLPDLGEQDIAGSGFAIIGYVVHDQLGGHAALGRLRERLGARGLRLLLDFVPNHTSLSRRIWFEPRSKVPTRSCSISTIACSPCCDSRSSATASGSCSNSSQAGAHASDGLRAMAATCTSWTVPRSASMAGLCEEPVVIYGLLIGSRPVIAWNMIGAVINLLTVAAYLRFARREDRAAV